MKKRAAGGIVLLFSLCPHALGEESGIVTQGKWAQALVRTLGWERAGIPPNGTYQDYFSLLVGRDRFEVDGRAFQRKYGEAPGSYYYYVNVPRSGRYFLKAMVLGGPQFWTIDGGSSVLTEAKGGWEPADIGTFVLFRGTHLVRVTIPTGSSLASFSMDSSCAVSIEPIDAWHESEPLTYAAKAATVVRALDLENRLPQEGSHPFTQGGGGNATTYSFSASQPTTLTLAVRFPGTSRGGVSAQGCGRIPYAFVPSAGAGWLEIFTKTFPQGQHTVRLVVDAGPPPGSVRFIRRSTRPEDFIKVLEDLKMEEGPARELVAMQKARINLQKIQVARGIERVKESYYLPGEPGPEGKLPSEKVAAPYREAISPLLPSSM